MNANVEDRGIKGDCTPLMEAASAGHVDIVKLLINHGADVNAQSSSGELLVYFNHSLVSVSVFLTWCLNNCRQHTSYVWLCWWI